MPIITQNYLELLADENPILYTGTNQYGNRILGVIVEESDEDFTVRYFHIIVNDQAYYSFINREISLRKIIETANIIFALDFNGGKLIDNNLIVFEDIPKDYLPLEDSLCPEGFFVPSLNFGVSLKGKKSEMHLVEVADANSVQTSFADVLKNALNGIHELGLKPKCYLEPAEVGSFKVNYRIEFENAPTFFSIDSKLIAEYVKSLLNYIVTKLPKEEKNVLKEENISSVAFKEVEGKLRTILEESHVPITNEQLEQKLIENINESAARFEDLSNQIANSDSFNKIEIINYQSNGGELGLGVIDQTFFASIKEQLPVEPQELITDVYQEDANPQTYRIRVYQFNTETGTCKAHFYPEIDSEESSKIPIRINRNGKEYHHSILSKSLDEQKVINVQGKAMKKNGVVESILIDL